ncbi:MAG: YfhO family protein [Verrucomicrobiota bacterium]
MTGSRRTGLWVTLAVSLLYCLWLGSNWLPLPYSDKELAASASRVWDIKSELVAGHGLPWWTPNFMSGSSYAINHTRGFYLVPWIAFSAFTDFETAGKLMALLAIFASGLAMYGCARYFLKNDWAAALAGIAFVLHPAQLNRAAGAEHMTIALFFPFVPLLWWTFARMLKTNQPRDIALCALTACFAMWTDNKQAVINFLFLAVYIIYWYWPKDRRPPLSTVARTFGLLALLGLTTGAILIVPGVIEAKYVKLFAGDPLVEWQKNYSFKSLFGLVDRDAAVTKDITASVLTKLQTRPLTSQTQADGVRRIFGLQMDSPEKYAGLVFLAILAVTALWNYRRENRSLFWFFVGVFMLSVMLATGLSSVFSANMKTFDALTEWGAVSAFMWLAVLAVIAFLATFVRRKATTPQKRLIAGGALVTFLFVPGFAVLANLPYFREIRAPYSFYDGPVAFWCAILLAFCITDLIKARVALAVAGISVLLLIDFWPYQKPTKDNGVPASTIKNLAAAYGSLKADKDWVKTYSISGRYFHLLGPMFSGKPQVYEAFYNWQAPLGLGLLHNAGAGSRELLNLVGARYIILDKTDPGMQQQKQMFDAYRQAFQVAVENDDFIVVSNPGARPYVSATTRVCTYTGELSKAAPLALALAARNYTLVHDVRLANAVGAFDDRSTPSLPATPSEALPLRDVQLSRDGHQHIRIKLTAPSACVVVINESYYPFWRATVDGQSTAILRVNCALMGVTVPEGSHEVVLQYKPPVTYIVSGIVSVLGLVGALGLIVRRRNSSRSVNLSRTI